MQTESRSMVVRGVRSLWQRLCAHGSTFTSTVGSRVASEVLPAFLWRRNCCPPLTEPLRVHLGCGSLILEGFVNMDLLPTSERVFPWDILQLWPEELTGKVSVGFSEDVLEHLFYPEQTYLLCAMNIALREHGVFRILTPNLDQLIAVGQNYSPGRHPFYGNFGVVTGADAINYGMRMGYHRWLHNQDSLMQLASHCGYDYTPTSCNVSTVPDLSGINIRNESNSLSFAADLTKRKGLIRIVVFPSRVKNAVYCGKLGPAQPIYRAYNKDPQVHYTLPISLQSDQIVLLCFRSANFSEWGEHHYATVHLGESAEGVLELDSSMASSPHAKLVTIQEIKGRIHRQWLGSLRLDPGRRPGDVFSTGPLEIFYCSRKLQGFYYTLPSLL